MTTSRFIIATRRAEALGHDLEDDPPAIMSSVHRKTCRRCGRSVLGNYNAAYGSAMDELCSHASMPPKAP